MIFKRDNTTILISKLIEVAQKRGLRSEVIQAAQEYLEYNEWGLAFDTIITQLYEYDFEIKEQDFKLIVDIAMKMELPEDEYIYINELITK